MGNGVFTAEELGADMIIEESPVIVMGARERSMLDQTKLHDYIFVWAGNKEECCMALGYVPLYNHSYKANCEYEMLTDKKQIRIKTVRPVLAGEELFINYNGDWNDPKTVWFEAK